MRKHIKIFTTTLLLILIICINILNVSAGSVTLSFKGNDTVKLNDNITITVAASNITGLTDGMATAQGDVIFDDAYLEYVSYKATSQNLSVSYGTKTKRFVALGLGGEYISSNDDLFNLVFKAKKVGQTKLNISNVVIGDTKAIIHSSNVVEKTINIVEESSTPSENPTPPTNNTPSTPSKTPSTSTKDNNKKDNTKSDNTTTSDKTNKGTDNKLSKLIINNSKITPSFSPDVTNYTVTIPSDIDKLNIDCITNDKNAKVSITGNEDLKNKENAVIKITVTAEDGSQKVYTLNINKSNDIINNKLLVLNVKEGDLSSDFDKDKYEYTVTVPKKTKKLTIDAVAEDKDSKIEYIGNKNLGSGRSVVLIKLTDKNGYSNYYRLNVKKENKITLFGIDVKYIITGLMILIALILLLLIILSKRKKKKQEVPIEEDENTVEDDLYDDIVTKQELITAIEEKNPKKIKMLLTQEKVNKLKEELKTGQDLYDDTVTKEELISAIEERDPKKLKMLLTQEEVNRLKDELKKEENK